MPYYTVNVTTTNYAWYVTEADSPQEAVAAAREAGARYFDSDDSNITFEVDTVTIEDEDGLDREVTFEPEVNAS